MGIFNKIFIVVVLYKTRLEDSRTIQSLNKYLSGNVDVFVFDNSPIHQYEKEKFIYDKLNISYYYDILNPGLAIAYNKALNKALLENKKWLLLLDQDTLLSQSYIDELFCMSFDNFSNKVVAIIPKVVSRNNNPISPAKMFVGGISRPVNLKEGIVKSPITAINSGALLRTDYMNSVDGFNINFPLDMLDHWYFRKIFKDKKWVYLMKSSIEQDLSVSINFEHNISFDRYKMMLTAEYLFIKQQGVLWQFVFRIRLFLKIIKQFRFKNSNYYKYTLNNIFSDFK